MKLADLIRRARERGIVFPWQALLPKGGVVVLDGDGAHLLAIEANDDDCVLRDLVIAAVNAAAEANP